MSRCVECDAEITPRQGAERGEIIECPDCGTELEVTAVAPFTLARAPQEQEDWGE